MKTKILTIEGKEGKEIEMPEEFSSRIREDICQKCFEIEKIQQPFAPFLMAGKQHSASGKIKRMRKAWKTGYGHGLARIPRKIFWRRGNQFYWVGAEVASTRGGRRAHPPRVDHFQKKLKMNKKEKIIARNSGFAATILPEYVKRRYERFEEIKLPVIVDSSMLKLKTKEFVALMEKILGKNTAIAFKEKRIRPGKSRISKYKKTAGLLLITGDKEDFKFKGIDVRKISQIKMEDLYPLGRLAVYTENAIKEMGERK